MSMFDLTGKIALVTGAASGIGEAIASTYARQGAYVYVADIDESNGNRVAGEIENDGGEAGFLRLNVTQQEECRKAVDIIHAAHGYLDILVNNAGLGHVGNILATTAQDLDRLYAVNVRGMFDLTKAFLPNMIERRSGVVINLSSVGGVAAVSERIAYCTTKFAVVGFTKCLALDHAMEGIRANCICPGRVETPFVKARLAEYPDPEKAYREMAATQALGRMGKPEEIAAAALYLASDEAAFVTGSALMIEGGFTVGK